MSEPSAAASSTPVAGEARPRPGRHVKRVDLAKRLALIIGVLTVLGSVAGAVQALGTKADGDAVAAVERRGAAQVAAVAARVGALEAEAAATRADMRWLKEDNSWIKSALWALTQKAGLAVPAPPPARGDTP